jgi:dihydroxyacetone kinase phosphoprotein-dependent L subunit
MLLRGRFAEARPSLDALDGAIGDGDHGTTISRAFQASDQATARVFNDLGEMFDVAAQALAESAGGAIGPLLAAFFAEGGNIFQGKQVITGTEILLFLSGGLEAVKDIGGAARGDKTLVDALAPAVDAFASSLAKNLSEQLQVSINAARTGAEMTRDMVARHGRARFLGERSVGHPDPGATSLVILLEALQAAVDGQKGQPLSLPAAPFILPAGKLINHPDTMIQQDNEGLALAFPRLVRLDEHGILRRAVPKDPGKVGLAIGHGGGHTPSMGGFIGPGLLDADVYGPLFTCASGVRIARAIAAADQGAGVVLLVSNHSGDVLNARLAVRRSAQLGLRVEPVLLGDDIATAPRQDYLERRGLGGLLFSLKMGGAAAEAGWPLEEVAGVMQKANQRTASLAVAVRPATHPVTGQPLFTLPEGQVEVGTGVHGEVGVYRGKHMPADQLIDMIVERLVEDLSSFSTRDLLIFLNGSGGTSQMELHILYRRAHQVLNAHGYNIKAGVVDSFFTTQEMGGFSLSLCAIDDEMAALWDTPARSPSFHWPYC